MELQKYIHKFSTKIINVGLVQDCPKHPQWLIRTHVSTQSVYSIRAGRRVTYHSTNRGMESEVWLLCLKSQEGLVEVIRVKVASYVYSGCVGSRKEGGEDGVV